MTNWQEARLIPVAGTSGQAEAEQRATSAMLAVLGMVRPFSKALLSPLGASRAGKARVETFIETSFKLPSKKTVRPDGLIRVTYGSQPAYVILVEVKTGTSKLEAEQIESYIDVARNEGYDCVLTISNEISPTPGVHPAGVKVQSNSRVALHHVSWTRVLTTAVMEKIHCGIDDPEQSWILGELIRYLEHPASGTVKFDDMGENWTTIRDACREGTLTKRSDGVGDIAQRWDQLLGYSSLKLGADIGRDVVEMIPQAQRSNPALRAKAFVDSLVASAELKGVLRIPDTIDDLEILVDLKARQSVISVDVKAPKDKSGRGRIGWLVGQLKNAQGQLVVEAYTKNAHRGLAASLSDVRENSAVLIGEDKKSPVKFQLVARSELGVNRKSGRGRGFAQSVIKAIESFYGDVLEHLVAYQAKAAKLPKPKSPEVGNEPLPSVALVDSPRPVDRYVTPGRPPPLPRWGVGQ